MEDILFYQNYVAAGDILSLVLCIVVEVLMKSTYTMKKTNLHLFRGANRMVALAAISSLGYHWLIDNLSYDNVGVMCFLHSLTYSLLIATFVCYCVYIRNLVEIEKKSNRLFWVAVYGMGALFTVMELADPYMDINFYVDENLQIHQNYYTDFFRVAYIYFFIVIAVLLVTNRKKLIAKIYKSMWCIILLCVAIMVYQAQALSTTYTTVAFAIPVVGVLFLFHYNAYDVETGTLDQYAFSEYMNDIKGKNFSIISLSMPDIRYDNMRKLSIDFIRKNDTFFNGSCCFRLRNNRIVLVYQKEKNPNYKETLEYLFNEFVRINSADENDYKIVLTDCLDTVESGMQYINYFEYIEHHMPMNSVKICDEESAVAFTKYRYLVNQVKDIFMKEDLEDPRVKVYCQPVLNTEKNTFTTAEALMRLELPEMGMIYPDQFIPLMERFNYIHVFSKIILNKTCKAIRVIEDDGYLIERVSINFSMQELKLDNFSQDIRDIILANGVEPSKIAIELTESKNEKDLLNMKRVMEELQEQGIKFYLDDFGTGYSNFERILGLPIDIIKFDRSLTLLAGKSDETKYMVGSFSEIFKKAEYQILFEGVEDEKDEAQCKDMNALYLQGYRYSKPIPIERLPEFLGRK